MTNTSLDHTNEFGIIFSTVNGSGSATANKTILKAIYKMGITVSGRNIFPSNIQGMPTRYSIRVSGKGYLGRLEKENILVCLNPEVIEEDIKKIKVCEILIRQILNKIAIYAEISNIVTREYYRICYNLRK